jgi:hypothetical protein
VKFRCRGKCAFVVVGNGNKPQNMKPKVALDNLTDLPDLQLENCLIKSRR